MKKKETKRKEGKKGRTFKFVIKMASLIGRCINLEPSFSQLWKRFRDNLPGAPRRIKNQTNKQTRYKLRWFDSVRAADRGGIPVRISWLEIEIPLHLSMIDSETKQLWHSWNLIGSMCQSIINSDDKFFFVLLCFLPDFGRGPRRADQIEESCQSASRQRQQ